MKKRRWELAVELNRWKYGNEMNLQCSISIINNWFYSFYCGYIHFLTWKCCVLRATMFIQCVHIHSFSQSFINEEVFLCSALTWTINSFNFFFSFAYFYLPWNINLNIYTFFSSHLDVCIDQKCRLNKRKLLKLGLLKRLTVKLIKLRNLNKNEDLKNSVN